MDSPVFELGVPLSRRRLNGTANSPIFFSNYAILFRSGMKM
jgi:hypothetical protein